MSQRMTRLQAVNRILRAAREHPVSSLDDSATNDTELAQQELDEVSREVQAVGLNLNTFQRTYEPDPDTGRIPLPATLLAVQGAGRDAHRLLTFRVDDDQVTYLYDLAHNRFDFPNDTSLELQVIRFVGFEELPLLVQSEITDQAAVNYQMAVRGSESLHRILMQRAAMSRIRARAMDIRHRGTNQFRHGLSNGPRQIAYGAHRNWH